MEEVGCADLDAGAAAGGLVAREAVLAEGVLAGGAAGSAVEVALQGGEGRDRGLRAGTGGGARCVGGTGGCEGCGWYRWVREVWWHRGMRGVWVVDAPWGAAGHCWMQATAWSMAGNWWQARPWVGALGWQQAGPSPSTSRHFPCRSSEPRPCRPSEPSQAGLSPRCVGHCGGWGRERRSGGR